MGKVGQESDSKSNLVTEICFISSLSNACVHTRQSHSQAKPSPFIDWYRLLGVEEGAEIGVIRKRYHKLALQVHPDKNKHPKADIAFKLVSEAHTCLSDSAKRRAYDLERWRNFCFQCNAAPPPNPNSPKNKPRSSPSRSKSCRFSRGLKDIGDRFREETRVIEKCLKVNYENSSSRKESSLFDPSDRLLRSNSHRASHVESPIFNPSNHAFDGYPHVRNRAQKKPNSRWYLQVGNVLNSPIFEVRSDSRIFRGKSACVRS